MDWHWWVTVVLGPSVTVFVAILSWRAGQKHGYMQKQAELEADVHAMKTDIALIKQYQEQDRSAIASLQATDDAWSAKLDHVITEVAGMSTSVNNLSKQVEKFMDHVLKGVSA